MDYKKKIRPLLLGSLPEMFFSSEKKKQIPGTLRKSENEALWEGVFQTVGVFEPP